MIEAYLAGFIASIVYFEAEKVRLRVTAPAAYIIFISIIWPVMLPFHLFVVRGK